MSIAFLVALVVTGAVVTTYLRRVPRSTFITTRYFGRDVTFSRRGIWLQPVPDRYTHDGFSHVALRLSGNLSMAGLSCGQRPSA